MLSGFHCFLRKQRKTKYWKLRWLKVRWEHEGTLLSYLSSFSLFLTNSCPSIWSFLPSLGTLCHFLYIFSLSLVWRILILLSVFKQAHPSDSPWPFIGALSDRQHSPRWKAHRKGRETAGRRRYGYIKNMWQEKRINLKRDKRAGSHLPGELPCLGKQAPALARRETCQGLICVFVHTCASKHTRAPSHDHQKSAIVKWEQLPWITIC